MKKLLVLALGALVVGGCGDAQRLTGPADGLRVAHSEVTGASVQTDKDDYAPGETVTITGSGWTPAEIVRLTLTEQPADSSHPPLVWDVQADGDGAFIDTSFSPQVHHLGVTFTLEATGLVSGSYAQTTFTDGNVVGATTPSIFQSDCATSASTFTLGSTVCAKTTITVQTPPPGDGAFRFQWVGPAPFTTIARETSATGANGSTHQDAFTPSAAGTWTVRICKPSGNCPTGGNLLSSATFEVTAPAPDLVAPVVTVSVPSAPAGQAGYFNAADLAAAGGAIVIQVSATDASGVASLACTSALDGGAPQALAVTGQTGTDPRTGTASVSADGTHTIVCTATDGATPANSGAGAGSTNTATVMVDATSPVVVADPTQDSCSLPGNSGWCRGTQTAGFGASDATSGLADASQASFTQSTSTNGSAVSVASGPVADNAGNVAAGISAGPYMIDSVEPVVVCATPMPSFLLNQPGALVSANVTDATSGPLASPATSPANTATVGSKVAIVSGEDVAGNTASASCYYAVAFAFEGLYAPVDRPSVMNVTKAGQAVPLKWRLTDYNGAPVLDLAAVRVVVSLLACAAGTSSDLVEEVASGASGLQNNGDGYYQFNWKTPTSYASSCKLLSLDLGEGAMRSNLAYFQFRK